MKYEFWDRLAYKYNSHLFQKYSLKPTRKEVKKIVFELLKKNNNLKILDIGCGTGQLIEEVNNEYGTVNYLGIDVSKEMIEIARNCNKYYNFKNISIDDFETNEKFDIKSGKIYKAEVSSIKKTKSILIEAGFNNKNVKIIREKFYMPTIALFLGENV